MKKFLICDLFLFGCGSSVSSSNKSPWQQIPSASRVATMWRQPVPNGWLVYARDTSDGAFVFVPDVAHVWSGW